MVEMAVGAGVGNRNVVNVVMVVILVGMGVGAGVGNRNLVNVVIVVIVAYGQFGQCSMQDLQESLAQGR